MQSRTSFLTLVAVLASSGLAATASAASVASGEWASWRGPNGNSVSQETDLPDSLDLEGDGLLWRVDFTGRSTPVVFDGRVCANGRAGEETQRQEMVACFDAATGKKLWERRFVVFHTTVPWNRVGWANVTGDPETGYLYVQGVGGLFSCLDREGEVVWSRNLMEDYGFMEGYGGRTQTPVIDRDRVIVTFSNNSWGEQRIPRHRLFAFDKRTGEPEWISQPGNSLADKNSQSTPIVTEVDGRRLIVHGNGNGSIYAVDAATGAPVWEFDLSKRGINVSVTRAGNTIIASHSEENVDEGTMGRVVAIDPTGEGNVTATHEQWRSPVSAGFSSAVIANERVYVVDNSANLHALDFATGKEIWVHNLGRVGKGSPAWGDDKIYVTTVNGRVLVVADRGDHAETLSMVEIPMPGTSRMAEIYGSPAIANGRVFFSTEEGLYAVGHPREAKGAEPSHDHGHAEAGPATRLLAMPAEVSLAPGESAAFRVAAYDGSSRETQAPAVTWSLEGLEGSLTANGTFVADPAAGFQQGHVVAHAGELAAKARVRVARTDSWSDDLEGWEAGSVPPVLTHSITHFKIEEEEGNHYLVKIPSSRKIHRHNTFVGLPSMSGYTIQADLRGTQSKRNIPDMGLINSGYTLDLMGGHQRLQVRSWPSVLRMMKQVDFPWEPNVWYTMKFEVEQKDGHALLRGKVWPRDEPEPEAWTLEHDDDLPIEAGSPGLYGYSPAPIHYDNLKVTVN